MEEINTTELIPAEREDSLEVRPIEVITAEICFYKQQAGAAFIEIGRRLNEAKAQLSHGEWLPWLEEKVEFSSVVAQRFMRLAREYENASPATHLGVSKALALLALPVSERDEFMAEKHLVNGVEKTVEEMSRRELEQAIKERDAAVQKAADAESTIRDLERAAEEADNRAKGYEMKLEQVNAQAAKDLAKAEADYRDLQAQLEELQNTPQSVAVEPVVDKAAISAAEAAARKEAEEKLKTKIEKAEKAKEKAEQAKNKAEQDLAALKVSQEEASAIAEREKQSLSEQVQLLQKKLAVASSSEMTIFKLHFEQGQNSINKMVECIAKMKDAGETDGAAKLENALKSLLTAHLAGLK